MQIKKRIEGPILREGDPVYLLRKNIKTKRPSKKLDHTKLGPFRIKDKLGTVTYRLELPKDMKIHPVFHVALLEPAPRNVKLAESVPLDDDMDVYDYQMERVLGARLIHGKPHFLSPEALQRVRKAHPGWFRPEGEARQPGGKRARQRTSPALTS